ncbi:MAG: S1 family peptidase [Bacteroidales bacterium]|nr:S1 family peptidase [Candidatus Latescibacterota bacterium]
MKLLSRTRFSWVSGIALLVAFGMLAGCSGVSDNLNAPDTEGLGLVQLSKADPRIQSVMAVQDRHTGNLMSDPEVVGTATGLDDKGTPAIFVYLETSKGGKNVPAEIEGIPVMKIVSGKMMMLRGGGTSTTGHTARYPRPISLGVSGGNSKDFAYPYCCSGTLGALLQDGSGTQFILSNKHVFAGDQAASANDPDVAEVGNEINQPGLIEVGCQDLSADYVANLSAWCVDGNDIDAALAEVMPGMVDPGGSILEIGELSATTMDAYVGLNVKKSGRTSGLTRAYVSALNATFTVGGSDECGGEATTELFTGQIVVTGNKFLQSGDSGSLLVEDVAVNPRAVGLLFAGSTRTAIANPIDNVLNYFGMYMVGN